MISRWAPITTLTAHKCRRMSAAATMQRTANVPSLADRVRDERELALS